MCLTCGAQHCGRKNWDGTGGNGHAIEHSNNSGHHCVLKLASCCRSEQEVYCYACDNEVNDLEALRKRLKIFKLEYLLERGTGSEESLAELFKKENILSAFSTHVEN